MTATLEQLNAMLRVDFPEDLGCTIPWDTMYQQVEQNIKLFLPQARPYEPRFDQRISLVCGGPTLEETKDELVESVWNGNAVCCVNGTYDWCIKQNIRPNLFVMLDGREFNAEFVRRPIKGCRYLLASQCHPKVFEVCADRDVTIWHAVSGGEKELEMIKKYYLNETHPIMGGTTVAIRAILLLRMLGFTLFDIYGMDSCVFDKRHHAYEQKENDQDPVYRMWLRPKGRDDLVQEFWCSPWMAKQCYDLQMLMRHHGDKFHLNVYGRGLIAAIIKTSAQIEWDKEAAAVAAE